MLAFLQFTVLKETVSSLMARALRKLKDREYAKRLKILLKEHQGEKI